MTELIKRDLVIDKLKQGYFDTNLQQAKNDPCVIDAMIDWSIRQVKDVPIYNPWHTGTPTEEGWYLLECSIGDSDETYYVTDYWSNMVGYWTVDSVIRWQKIKPSKEGV